MAKARFESKEIAYVSDGKTTERPWGYSRGNDTHEWKGIAPYFYLREDRRPLGTPYSAWRFNASQDLFTAILAHDDPHLPPTSLSLQNSRVMKQLQTDESTLPEGDNGTRLGLPDRSVMTIIPWTMHQGRLSVQNGADAGCIARWTGTPMGISTGPGSNAAIRALQGM